MRIVKDTEWRDELVTVGYHAITQVDDNKEVEVSIHGTCDSNGWCDRFITEEGMMKNSITMVMFLLTFLNLMIF